MANAGDYLYAPDPASQAACLDKTIETGKKYNAMMEKNLTHHSGKFAAGNKVGIADFIMAAYVGNFIMNNESPFSAKMQEILVLTPKFK